MEITARNANGLFSEMFWKFKTSGVTAESRNGPVVRINEPVLTTVKYPMERVLFHVGRDANPVFHLMESLWMLAGRRDVAFLQQFNSTIGKYSDDGKQFNAAYGHRWRKHFGHDQLVDVIGKLRRDPNTRQAVVQMWDSSDLTKNTKDRACNTQLVFEVLNGCLNMTVFNRSNDAWYGYAGANIVHFTVLQEFVALAVGVKIGCYRTFSTNLHLYTKLYDATTYLDSPPRASVFDHYSSGAVRPSPLMAGADYKEFLQDCDIFCKDPFNQDIKYKNPFFNYVAQPMAMVSRIRKIRAGDGRGFAAKIRAEDWRRAAFQWIDKRDLVKAEKE